MAYSPRIDNKQRLKGKKMTVENKIDRLIQESEKEREAAQPSYVTPEAGKAIKKAENTEPQTDNVQTPDLDVDTDEGSHIAGILNKLGDAADAS